jgi:3-oxoacyl-[acyl-carrier protein] reductase
MKALRGKTALVTGAAGGIGRAIAVALAREGVSLYPVEIDDANLEVSAREARDHGVDVVSRHCDLGDAAQIAALVEALLAHWGQLNILINNAGVAERCHSHEMSDAEWNRIMSINLLAPIALTRMLLPTLLANEAHILNVSSIFGLASTRKMAAYQTSKFGLVGFTTALRTEYCSARFGATAFCPAFVNTRMLVGIAQPRSLPLPPNWLQTTPEKAAAKAIDAIRKNKGIVVVNPLAHLNWLVARLSPALLDFFYRRPWRHWGKRRREHEEPTDVQRKSVPASTDAANM